MTVVCDHSFYAILHLTQNCSDRVAICIHIKYEDAFVSKNIIVDSEEN